MTDKNVRKLKDKAARFIQKRKFEKALEIYDALLLQAPGDTALMLKIGDINRRMGHNRTAIDIYTRAADHFAEDGMLLKGIAVCKIILEIDPHHKGVEKQLENLYTSQYGSLPRRKSSHPKSESAATPLETAEVGSSSSNVEIEIDGDLTEMENATVDKLPEIPLLSDLDREAFVELLGRIPLHSVGAGETIVHEDEIGNSFFILVEGSVRIVKTPGIQLAELGPGAFFGEMAIIAPRRRRASVITTEPSEILEILRDDLDSLTARYPHIYSVLTKFTEQRLLKNLMVTSSLFTPFPPDERKPLIDKFEIVKFLRGQTIIEQNKDVAGLFLIASGAVEIDCDGEIKASLSEGEIVGETSLLLRSKATATVRATKNTRALLLPRSVFNELIMTHPQILELINDLKEERLNIPSHVTSLPRDLFSEMDGGSALL
jgi:CRP-like cAMP-binding protein